MMNFLTFAAAVALSLAPFVAGGAMELTLETFDDKIGSKNAFIKFYASWYVHMTFHADTSCFSCALEFVGVSFMGRRSRLFGFKRGIPFMG